jgi:hypothetical protein
MDGAAENLQREPAERRRRQPSGVREAGKVF